MPTKRNPSAFEFPAFQVDWPMPTFSNWAFAQPEDRVEDKTVTSLQKMGTTMWSHAEKAFDDHMEFVSHRLHEDFECAKSLSQCVAPEQTVETLQAFYSKMATEYQEHFEKQAALFRNSYSENAAAVEELNETAMENVSEITRAAEESLQGTNSPAPKKRSGGSAAKKAE